MKFSIYLFCALLLLSFTAHAQDGEDSPMNDKTFSGLKLRNIGPAFTSGRIADIAIHPEDNNVWYIAVGSGGVWKTINAGTTWTPVFDDQPSYSTGCVTIDPRNPHTVWVGTGENVGGRHVGYGDGIYKSSDGGKSWENMGLKASEHISNIIVHPDHSDVIWVAVQGPLWNPGGERGLYKTIDGGKTWKQVLGNDEWTGVTDIVIDPRDPDVLYAATWDRHRTVAAYMGGGPGTGLHKSMDGGETWMELTKGLPTSNMGKIGLAISPQNPDILYAAIELDRKTGGLYRSTDRGASWEKRSDAVSGATGPHYYQELYASPHHFDKIYLMDVRIQVSEDGGKTFERLTEEEKHSDNHAMAFRMDDPDYLLIGTDGGMYESFDDAKTWRFFDNLPITQYYKLAVDDAEPFYWVYGGTQDNGSHGGPSRTDTEHGIRNADWIKTLGADGHQSAIEPGNPDIMYAEAQQGRMHRVDRITGDQVLIQPQPGPGEDYERYNWDAPILVSAHDPARLYFASQRVWRSDNRGDSWEAISGDLTRDEERLALPIMGKIQSWDNPWDVGAMSNYNTITSLGESPLNEDLVYVGTDDGIIQITEDGGQNWRKIMTESLPGVPERAFINDIRADLHDENTVYVALDDHKTGDFSPYLYKSTDRGNTWTSISGNIPDRTLIWRIVQDHVDPELLFTATEFGIYMTIDGGDNWMKLEGGVPTISFRDITIQRRENDLVAASFGRGFFIFDDISVFREVDEETLAKEGALFSTRKAYWYKPRSIVSSQAATHYTAPNPPFGAVFTYHLADGLTTLEAQRKEKEKELEEAGEDIPFPGWEALEEEVRQEDPKIWLSVKDSEGNLVRKVKGPVSKGFHRVAWDFRHAPKSGLELGDNGSGYGLLAAPGTYTVTLSKEQNGVITELAGPQEFEVVPLREGALEGASPEEWISFRQELEELQSALSAANAMLERSGEKLKAMEVALTRTDKDNPALVTELNEVKKAHMELEMAMSGPMAKREVGEKRNPTVMTRMYTAMQGLSTTYGPTPLHKQSLEIAQNEFNEMKDKMEQLANELIPQLEESLKDAGAPWIEGQPLPAIGEQN